MTYKYKYLIFTTRPKEAFGFRDTVAQIDVNHLNKRGINEEWDRLSKKYLPEIYLSSLTRTNQEMRIFQDEPTTSI